MDRITLGRTGLQVSVMGLGAGGDSKLGLHNHEERESTKLVHEALARGVNFIDTAEAYGTEARLGKALRGRTRGDVVLSTKKTTNPQAGRLENLQSLERGPLSAADHARLVELFGQIDDVSGH